MFLVARKWEFSSDINENKDILWESIRNHKKLSMILPADMQWTSRSILEDAISFMLCIEMCNELAEELSQTRSISRFGWRIDLAVVWWTNNEVASDFSQKLLNGMKMEANQAMGLNSHCFKTWLERWRLNT